MTDRDLQRGQETEIGDGIITDPHRRRAAPTPLEAGEVPARAADNRRLASYSTLGELDFETADLPLLWEAAQRGLAALALIATSPLWPILYLAVRVSSSGPLLFRQRRRGLRGREIHVLKIRTLTLGTERSTALGVDRHSPVVTRVGRILRRLKLDELPQLWNVARGEMNLVGPRPLPLALDAELQRLVPNFAARYRVRPGLTSLAQVAVIDNRLGGNLERDWSERFEAELHYLRHRSLRYDLLVLGLTALYLLRTVLGRRRRTPTIIAEPPSAAATAVLGVPISNLDYDGVIEQVAHWVRDGASRVVAICPVHSVVESLLDDGHRRSLASADLCTADGMPVVWAQRRLGWAGATRVYGPELMDRLLGRAARAGWRVAFVGGKPGRLVRMLRRLHLRHPALRIADAFSPPFHATSAAEDHGLVERLVAARADLVFVGLGCPKQERFMAEHRGRIPGVMLGVGAAFDFAAGAVAQAPRWMQRSGLEWLFRLWCEPRRLFWRYAKTNPIFVVRLAMQLARERRRKRGRGEDHHNAAR